MQPWGLRRHAGQEGWEVVTCEFASRGMIVGVTATLPRSRKVFTIQITMNQRSNCCFNLDVGQTPRLGRLTASESEAQGGGVASWPVIITTIQGSDSVRMRFSRDRSC
jgi:hypothetical protein